MFVGTISVFVGRTSVFVGISMGSSKSGVEVRVGVIIFVSEGEGVIGVSMGSVAVFNSFVWVSVASPKLAMILGP